MSNNYYHPGHQGPPPSGGMPSPYSQPPSRTPSIQYPLSAPASPHAQPASPSHINQNQVLHRQSPHPFPTSNLRQTQTAKMPSGPFQITDSPPESNHVPPNKKVKLDPSAAPALPKASPKPPAAAKPSNPVYPIIDIIPSGPRGDIVIQVSLPTAVATQETANASAVPKKTVLLRLHALLLTLHSPFFQDLLGAPRTNAVTGERAFTETSPWVLPGDWDGAAFLDWCVMVCGMSSVYDVVGEKERDTQAAQTPKQEGQQGNGGAEAGGIGGARKPAKGGDGGRMGRFPRVVALAEKLGCAKAMKFHCAMPLWRFFGPRGEADDEGLGHRGLTIL